MIKILNNRLESTLLVYLSKIDCYRVISTVDQPIHKKSSDLPKKIAAVTKLIDDRVARSSTSLTPEAHQKIQQLVAAYGDLVGNPQYHPLHVIATTLIQFLFIADELAEKKTEVFYPLAQRLLSDHGYGFCATDQLVQLLKTNQASFDLVTKQAVFNLRTGNNDLNAWYVFFLKSLATQIKETEVKGTTKKTIKYGDLTKTEEDLLEQMRPYQNCSFGFLYRHTNIKKPTLKVVLAKLKERGLIAMTGKNKGVRYQITS